MGLGDRLFKPVN